MNLYTHSSYSYVKVIEIPHDEISKIDFAKCAEPREKLSSFYNRQTEKPAILCNGSLFNYTGQADPIIDNINDGVVRIKEGWSYGIGTLAADRTMLQYGKVDGRDWYDYVCGYPSLLYGTGPLTTFNYATEINYNTVRTLLGRKENGDVVLVGVNKPGLAFKAMSQLMYDLDCFIAINLDGGGSSRIMLNGNVVNTPTEDRAVDNVVAIYLNCLGYTEYTVVSGDSWWKIASKQLGSGSKCSDLALFNGMTTSTVIHPGDVLKIPT